METLSSNSSSHWPHRLAVLLVCATFPLIWVGGLVTTYDAGMAVPDWPGTYGYNLFLYPWQTWLAGPWDLFIEHGHRLLGALAGILTIALVVVVHRCDARRWVRNFSWLCLAMVILQGVLGGARVVWDERQLAMIHGCVGPVFFALCVAMAAVSSKWWLGGPETESAAAGKLQRLAALTTLFAYIQLVLGAVLRHIPVNASPNVFRVAVLFHLLMAAVLLIHALLLTSRAWRSARSCRRIVVPATLLSLLVVLQLALGSATWIAKYSWPSFLRDYQFAAAYTVQADSMQQGLTVTLHVAVGSLILVTALLVMLRVCRLVSVDSKSAEIQSAAASEHQGTLRVGLEVLK